MHRRRAARSGSAPAREQSASLSDAATLLTGLALTGPAPYLVRRLQQTVTAIYSEEMAQHGVTAPQYAALSWVVATPNLDQNTTAFLAGIDRTTIVGVINRLARKGLLRRTVSKADRRARLLNPTPAGVRFISQVAGSIDRISVRLLEVCTPKERDLFCEITRRLLRDRLYAEAQQLTTDLSVSPTTAARRQRKVRAHLKGRSRGLK